MTSLLIVEDDVDLREELSDYLHTSGYTVTQVGSVSDAELALGGVFDLLILDISLPDGSGLELCRRIRPYIRSGIVMCTGRSERELRISGLNEGADAYLVKPVDPEELEATLVSLQRRIKTTPVSMFQPAPLPVRWRLDRIRQTLTGPNGKLVNLSQSERLLLGYVLQQPDRHASRARLLEFFALSGVLTDGRRLEALVSRLRSKTTEKTGLNLPLQPVYGKGYAFLDHAEMI